MKTTLAALAIALTATTASAADFNLMGTTVSVGGEFDANYTTGTEDFAVDFTQTAGIAVYGVDLSVEHKLDVLDMDEADFELFNGLDFEAGYNVNAIPGLRAYSKVGMDADFDFGNVTTGVAFAF